MLMRLRSLVCLFFAYFLLGLVQYVAAPALAQALDPHQDTSITTRVLSVYDGDTFSIRLGGLPDKVRLLGIDAPELHQARWGIAARARLAHLVMGRDVRLELDEKKPRDAYGRLLAYVYVNDTMVQKDLLLQGLAVAKSYGKAPRGFETLDIVMKEARRRKLGIWNDPSFVLPDVYRKQHSIGH